MFVQAILIWCALLLINFRKSTCIAPAEYSLKLVVATFRHGDRTPDPYPRYTKDPYINATYFPFGKGELTNVGKLREYYLGHVLRERYGTFLGNLYSRDIINASSTDFRRAIMSVELVLASLWPPEGTLLEWNDEKLNWQPIPYNIIRSSDSNMLSIPFIYCLRAKNLYNSYMTTDEGRAIEQKYRFAYDFVSKQSGINVTSIQDLAILYCTLVTEKEWGFKLPVWTSIVFPTFLRNATLDFYNVYTATPELRQVTGGLLLKQIINDFKRKIMKDPLIANEKMILYSGEEYNVIFQLAALNLYSPHLPSYSACILIELHQIDGDYGVQVLYKQKEDIEPNILQIPGCSQICPFSQFLNFVNEDIPETDLCNLN